MQFWQFLGDLHPRLVQFPLVLLLAGLLFDAGGLILRIPKLHFAAKILAAAGTFFLLFAFICGIYAEIWAGRAGIPQEQIEWHELMANISSWGFVVLMAWRIFLDADTRKSLVVYTVIGLAWYSLLVITGYLGGKLVFDYGAAVVGARANDVLSLHDLNVLATRQTDDNLNYSEWMHHIFGWMTLALSGSLFAHRFFQNARTSSSGSAPACSWSAEYFYFSMLISISTNSPTFASFATARCSCTNRWPSSSLSSDSSACAGLSDPRPCRKTCLHCKTRPSKNIAM